MKRTLSIVLFIAFAFTAFTSCSTAQKVLSAAELLDLGNKYLLEMNYEQAIVQFTKVIEIEPKNVRAYLGLAKAYEEIDDIDKAIEELKNGIEMIGEPDNVPLVAELNRLNTLHISQNILDIASDIRTAFRANDDAAVFKLSQSDSLIAYMKSIDGEHKSLDINTDGFLKLSFVSSTDITVDFCFIIFIDTSDQLGNGVEYVMSFWHGIDHPSMAEVWGPTFRKIDVLNGKYTGKFEEISYYSGDNGMHTYTKGNVVDGLFQGNVKSWSSGQPEFTYHYKDGYIDGHEDDYKSSPYLEGKQSPFDEANHDLY